MLSQDQEARSDRVCLEDSEVKQHMPASAIGRYLVALVAPLVVAGVTELTWPIFEQSPVSLFLIAVMFSAWYGGLGPGLLSMVVSFFSRITSLSRHTLRYGHEKRRLVYLVTLVAVGLSISALSELMPPDKAWRRRQP